MSRLSKLGKRIKRDMKRIVTTNLLNTSQVTVCWASDLAAPGVNFNINDESTYPDTMMESGTWPALIHFVAPTTSEVRRFAEVQAGDVICDFLDDVPLSGKKGVTFLVDRQIYTQKRVGQDLADYWDLVVSNQRIFRTVLLTKKSGA